MTKGFNNGNQTPAYGNEKSHEQIIDHLTTENDKLKNAYEDSLNMQKASNAGYESKISELTAEVTRLREALKVCSKSLATYGSHPIIEMQVNQPLTEKTK